MKPFGGIDIFIGFLAVVAAVLASLVLAAVVAVFLYAGRAIWYILKLFRKDHV